MLGENACWLPGTDHAGIATQNVVEKQLRAQGLTKEDLGREEFAERVWAWRREYGGTIINQLKRLGCACDYERERFTFDEGYVRAVLKVFVALYKKGYIYKDSYLVNWCPRCGTAISDLEVAHVEDQGHLYHVRYELEGGGRLDHRHDAPRDDARRHGRGREPRRRALRRRRRQHGRPAAPRPQAADRSPTSASSRTSAAAPSRSPRRTTSPTSRSAATTGSTPCRRSAPTGASPRPAARTPGSRSMEARRRVSPTSRSSAPSRRSRTSRTAWPPATAAARSSSRSSASSGSCAWTSSQSRPPRSCATAGCASTPERWGRVYIDWMDNLRPWCISRQLWWGHQLPVWYCEAEGCGQVIVEEEAPQACPDVRRAGPAARDRRARHLVQLGALAVRHLGLARRDAGPRVLLPDERAQHGARDHLPLGGAHGHDGPRVRRRGPVPATSTSTP